ncbi:MAG: cell division protein FtsL [Chitinispirillaceae bacterium]|nr:cell division protein FtsL [Chitinispirillaceae bacterium]
MKPSKRTRRASPVRIRPMFVALLVVAMLIAVPLLLVWKQAFITGASIKLEKMNDTLSAMNREIASLRMARERCADNERIEAIARSALALDYPSSDRITIVPAGAGGDRGKSATLLLSALRGRMKKGGEE